MDWTGKKVMVTNKDRLVFAGTVSGVDGDTVTLRDARMLIFRTREKRGIGDQAVTGPDANHRVGPAVSVLTVFGVNTISLLTDAASAAWEAEPWGK